jgi:hypothetical protein
VMIQVGARLGRALQASWELASAVSSGAWTAAAMSRQLLEVRAACMDLVAVLYLWETLKGHSRLRSGYWLSVAFFVPSSNALLQCCVGCKGHWEGANADVQRCHNLGGWVKSEDHSGRLIAATPFQLVATSCLCLSSRSTHPPRLSLILH